MTTLGMTVTMATTLPTPTSASAHLIGISGSDFPGFTFENSLDAFSPFYVNRYVDHHVHKLMF